jgi:NAD-dependent deacetylase
MQVPNIFVLTGAGVSAESGLSTFRDADGLWAQFPIEEVASIQGYERNPMRVLEFYNQRRGKLGAAKPNAAHIALAQLERAWEARGAIMTLCTQNIDNLHEQAGSRRVLHMHGELNKARCHDCGDVSLADGDLTTNLGCGVCGRIGGLRPHVVWFGETPLLMDEIFEAMAGAGLFVSIGTSGAVYPAARGRHPHHGDQSRPIGQCCSVLGRALRPRQRDRSRLGDGNDCRATLGGRRFAVTFNAEALRSTRCWDGSERSPRSH